MDSERFWNPYLAGVALGVVLLATFLVMGRGLGASGAAHRLAVFGLDAVASAHVDRTPALASAKDRGHPLDDWLVFEVLGVFLGGAVAAYSTGRLRSGVQRGPRAAVPARLLLALSGGVVMGIAARMARGCTSGQALTGGALLSVGAWVFMFAVFGGGYALAYVVRRQWT
jgi:uncharacterized protein